MNDENVLDNRFSKLVADISSEFPQTSEFIPDKDEPYFLVYIEKIKNNNPEIWRRFLTMLSKASKEIEEIINKKTI